MTTEQKRKILIKIQTLEKDIEELKRVKKELVSNGYSSATISSGSGSKSYTKMDISKVSTSITEMISELKEYRKMLADISTTTPKQIYTVYY